MNRARLIQYVTEHYGAEEEHPWTRYPNYSVFRHHGSRKWFALVMDIPKSRLGLAGDEPIDVLNVKCDPLLIGSLREETGVYPAYHMSKASWLTIALDGGLEEDKIKWLLELSYGLTAGKKKRK